MTAAANHLAITRVLAEYCRCSDDGRFEQLAELFAPDAELVVAGERTVGRAAIRDRIAARHTRDRGGRHMLSNIVVDIQGDKASAESDFALLRIGRAGAHDATTIGRYIDHLARDADGWHFTRREVVVLPSTGNGSTQHDSAVDRPTSEQPTSERGNVRGRATRELLILTAERLFAEQGISAVALREIAKAAGQRNNATIDYHFGSREDLLAAIYAYRARAVNERCRQLLQEVTDKRQLSSLDALYRALLGPHVEALRDPDNHFLRFLARTLTEEGRLNVVFSNETGPELDAVATLRTHLRECIPELSDELFASRNLVVMNWAVHRLAEFSRERHDATDDDVEQMFEELVVMLVGAMRAGTANGPRRSKKD